MFLLHLFYQVINDLLDPTGQNLRVREDAQVSNKLIAFNFLMCMSIIALDQLVFLSCIIISLNISG